MPTKLQNRVAKAVDVLSKDVTSGDLELDDRGLVAIDDIEFGELTGADLREKADAPRVNAEVRRAIAEIARRKLNKELAKG